MLSPTLHLTFHRSSSLLSNPMSQGLAAAVQRERRRRQETDSEPSSPGHRKKDRASLKDRDCGARKGAGRDKQGPGQAQGGSTSYSQSESVSAYDHVGQPSRDNASSGLMGLSGDLGGGKGGRGPGGPSPHRSKAGRAKRRVNDTSSVGSNMSQPETSLPTLRIMQQWFTIVNSRYWECSGTIDALHHTIGPPAPYDGHPCIPLHRTIDTRIRIASSSS